jgi:hypothetical protein
MIAKSQIKPRLAPFVKRPTSWISSLGHVDGKVKPREKPLLREEGTTYKVFITFT